MSIIPSFFSNQRINVFDPFSLDIWDPSQGLPFSTIEVEVEEGRVLQISGERSRESEEKNDKWHRVERSSGKFLRIFRLPENTKMDEVKDSMENGVLTVCVPKVEQKKPEVKSIEISGTSESARVPQGQIGAA
ncbi:hypothetical protein MKX01_040008 [Papaver californicum]|nr:hypothetical protein MKX01_040008 [Papaver californicum]